MLSKSAHHNPNYLCKVVKLGSPIKHPNADKLIGWIIDGNRIWTDMSRKEGDIGVYFPLEGQLNRALLSNLNLYADANMNRDPTIKGYFHDKARVKAVRLRGEPSMGFFLTWKEFEEGMGRDLGCPVDMVGYEFDKVDDDLIIWKYVVPTRQHSQKQGTPGSKLHQKSRIVENQFRKHIDTPQLAKNAYKLSPDDHISITYKLHGTSFVVGNVLTKRRLRWWEKALNYIGVPIKEEEYDLIYSSRNVIQNEYEGKKTNPYYEGCNVYSDIKDVLTGKLDAGITVYGEAVGYTRSGGCIQKDYDYGFTPPHKISEEEVEYKEGVNFGIYIYNVTYTNPEGRVFRLTDAQMREYCDYYGLRVVPLYYSGLAKDWEPAMFLDEDNHWNENFVSLLQEVFLEHDCHICNSKVPGEGIVVNVERLREFQPYKLKSFRFLEKETKDLDAGILDMEAEQSYADIQEEEVQVEV